MKSDIKLLVMTIMLASSAQVSANDSQLDLTQAVTYNINDNIHTMYEELNKQLNQSLIHDSQIMLNKLIDDNLAQNLTVLTTDRDAKLIAINTVNSKD